MLLVFFYLAVEWSSLNVNFKKGCETEIRKDKSKKYIGLACEE
jgi:hypothetical protein